MAQSEIARAMKQICDEKGISYESVLETVEMALAAAYRKDYGDKTQNIKVSFDPETGDIKAFDVKEVVEDLPEDYWDTLQELEDQRKEDLLKPKEEPKAKENDDDNNDKEEDSAADDKKEDADDKKSDGASKEISEEDAEEEEEMRKFNPRTQIELKEAKEKDKKVKEGEELKEELPVHTDFGRMAAQTAKQVIIQRIREAERETILFEFEDRIGELVSGFVQRIEGRWVFIDLGRTNGTLPPVEQVRDEVYRVGQRLKVAIKSVNQTPKGPEIIVSRSAPAVVKELFAIEVPEIAAGSVEIKSVSREAGSRSKIAVLSNEENVDPVGSCVGQRGARVQTVIQELGGEKIDIIEWEEDQELFIINALSPAKVDRVELIEGEEKIAKAYVRTDQLSLAIGKSGQNVRLAAQLTEWRIDIVEVSEDGEVVDHGRKDNDDAKDDNNDGDDEKGNQEESIKADEDNEDQQTDKAEDDNNDDDDSDQQTKKEDNAEEKEGEPKPKKKGIKKKAAATKVKKEEGEKEEKEEKPKKATKKPAAKKKDAKKDESAEEKS